MDDHAETLDDLLFQQAESELAQRLHERWPLLGYSQLIAGLYHPRSCMRGYLRVILRQEPETFRVATFDAVAALLDEDAAELWQIRSRRSAVLQTWPATIRQEQRRVGGGDSGYQSWHHCGRDVDDDVHDDSLLAAIEEGEGHEAADRARYALSAPIEDVEAAAL